MVNQISRSYIILNIYECNFKITIYTKKKKSKYNPTNKQRWGNMGMDMKYFSDFARSQPAHEDKSPKSKEFTLCGIKQTLNNSANF